MYVLEKNNQWASVFNDVQINLNTNVWRKILSVIFWLIGGSNSVRFLSNELELINAA